MTITPGTYLNNHGSTVVIHAVANGLASGSVYHKGKLVAAMTYQAQDGRSCASKDAPTCCDLASRVNIDQPPAGHTSAI